MTTVRETKRADELKPGDWLAEDENGVWNPNEVMAVFQYPTALGPRVHLTTQVPGKNPCSCGDLSLDQRFELVTEAELTAQREQAERERLADELRELARLIVNPAMPVPQHGIAMYGSFRTPAEVRAAAEVFSLPVESRKPNKGIQTTEWPLDRLSYEPGVHLHWLTISDEPEHPAEPEPERQGPWFEVGEWVWPRRGGETVMVTEVKPIEGSNPLRQQFRAAKAQTGGAGIWRQSDEYQPRDPKPAGPVVRCALSTPHEPHGTTFAPVTGIENGQCPGITADQES